MDEALETAKKLKWWLIAIIFIGGLGFSAAVTLGSLARAADLQAIDKRVTTVEIRNEDDTKRIDWLVDEVTKLGWSLHTAPTLPPTRRTP